MTNKYMPLMQIVFLDIELEILNLNRNYMNILTQTRCYSVLKTCLQGHTFLLKYKHFEEKYITNAIIKLRCVVNYAHVTHQSS